MPLDEHDLRHLRRALELAHTAIGRSDPNPRVGCVLADAQGHVIGEGATQRAGEAHAEVMALRAAQTTGADTKGGTAWVSLEPSRQTIAVSPAPLESASPAQAIPVRS